MGEMLKDKIGNKQEFLFWVVFDSYSIKSGSFCINADCMLRQGYFYFDSSDQIFLTAVL